jgi:steroid 5-alpha reductase family enzyme
VLSPLCPARATEHRLASPRSLFYWSHPHAEADSQRSALALGVLWVWALRLLYNYFRREEWHFGLREDWRFADMRLRFPRNWWWLSFFAAYVSQHALLFAATLPLYAVHSSRAPLGAWDVAAAAVALAGVLVQGVADYQLREFMVANALRQARGEKKVLVLNSGLWYYSRHPNYFGEQLFWWGMALFAVGLGRPLYVAGAALMTLLFHGASLRLVESRMREDPQRREAFDEYVRTTSPFLPLPKFA